MSGQDTLGGRLPLLYPNSPEGDQKDLYQLLSSTLVSWAEASGFKSKTTDGRFIGPFNPNLYSAGITPAFIQFVQAESKNTSLSKRVREVVILSVGAVWKAPYELYAHAAVARSIGLPESAIEALAAGKESEHLSTEEQIAHRFARQLAAEHRVEAELYREAESSFGRSGIVNMIYLIGIYLLTSAMLNAFEVPAPE